VTRIPSRSTDELREGLSGTSGAGVVERGGRNTTGAELGLGLGVNGEALVPGSSVRGISGVPDGTGA